MGLIYLEATTMKLKNYVTNLTNELHIHFTTIF
jgi:hypothetical protein